MAVLMAGKSFAPKNYFLHEKVKFTVSVRGRQWSSARYVQKTVEEFARVIQVDSFDREVVVCEAFLYRRILRSPQSLYCVLGSCKRNARRLDFIGENDRIQRLQLARADGSEPEELDVDATLEDVIIYRGDKHLVAIIISSKSPAPCNGSHEAEKLGLSSTMALPYQSKSKVRKDNPPKFQIRYGVATSKSVRPLKETTSGIPGLKPVPLLFKRRLASREPPQKRLQIMIPPSDLNPPTAFQDKRGKLAYDVDSESPFPPRENSNPFDGPAVGPAVCKSNGPVALVSSKSTPSPAELAHFLVKGSSLPSNGSTAVSDTSNPFWSKYIGKVAGFHSFASAFLRRFPMQTPSTMVCGSSTDNVAPLVQFLASHLLSVVPGNNDRVKPTREKPLEGSAPGERSNCLQFVGNGLDNAFDGGSQEKVETLRSTDTIMTSTPANSCPKSESIHGRSELIFFVNRRSKTVRNYEPVKHDSQQCLRNGTLLS